MIKKIFKLGLGVIFSIMLFFLFSGQALAATAVFTGTATMTASSATTVTIAVPGTALTKFVHSNGLTADTTDLTGIVFNNQAATTATTNGTNLVTLTFPIAAGTGVGGPLVFQAGVVIDTVNNTLTTISTGSIIDNAPPQISVSLILSNQIIINFSEPMTTNSVVLTTNPIFDCTPVWTNNNTTVSFQHIVFSNNQSFIATIGAGTDATLGLNQISNLPYVFNVANGVVQVIPVIPTNVSVSINSGATMTNSHDVVLNISAINAVSMRISNNPFFTDYDWQPYTVSKNWALSSGDGLKTIYAKFTSSSGVESDPISVNITVDSSYVSPVITSPVTPATPATPAVPTVTPAVPAVPAAPATPAKTYNFGTATLKNGSRGEAVKELQRFINQVLNLGLVVDGKLGPKTIAVIKQWQKDHGLVADGLIGAKTKAQMNASIK